MLLYVIIFVALQRISIIILMIKTVTSFHFLFLLLIVEAHCCIKELGRLDEAQGVYQDPSLSLSSTIKGKFLFHYQFLNHTAR